MTFEAPRNAFFTATIPNYQTSGNSSVISDSLLNPKDVLSLSVVEEMGKTITGELSLLDPQLLYGRIIRANVELDLSWGYKAQGDPVSSLFGQGTADLFTQKLVRNGLAVLALNPSGGGGQDGRATFACGFMSKGWFGSPRFAQYSAGTKLSLVEQIMSNMGIAAPNQFVYFDAGSDAYSAESVETQSETDFQFINRLAYEWRCLFKMGFDQTGSPYGVFCDFSKLQAVQQSLAQVLGVSFALQTISWKSGNAGDLAAISYDWRNMEGENGAGDNVKVSIVNGQPVFQRFTVSGDVVTVETLDTDKVQAYVDAGGQLGPVINAQSMQNPAIKQFWASAKQTTAPNGLGYTVNVHMFGNPSLTCGQLVNFNVGFPANLVLSPGGSPVQFMVKKATHTISEAGYSTDLEVVDMFTVSAVGVY